MQSLIVFIAIAVALAWALTNNEKCDNSDAAILGCVRQFFDLNNDSTITGTEINTGLSRMQYVPCCGVNLAYIMRCDTDEDGVLTMADWLNPNSTCLPTPNTRSIMCDTCVRNGYAMTRPPPARVEMKEHRHHH
jgi:hypothetical protein